MTAHQQSLSFLSDCVCGDLNCTIPFGNCHCGICGRKTSINRASDKQKGTTKGQPAMYIHGHHLVKHGHSMNGVVTKEYTAWAGMIHRCTSPNCEFWYRYGGRGITVCERWMHSFENFLADVGLCPEGCSIDRINNDGNYEPGNCKWSTASEQALNREKQTHCKRGHELTQDNCYIDSRHGGRICKTCVLEKSKRREKVRPPRDWPAERAKRKLALAEERVN